MKNPITSDKYKAVLFDLDGVLTSTEKIHSVCWKRMFDDFLLSYSKEHSIEFVPFDINKDYLTYVDGKPRYKGVEDFLESRNISLPSGDADDPHDAISVSGLGNKKNQLFNQMIEKEPVEVYRSSIRMVEHLKDKKFSIAVVSSSRNCKKILKAAGIENHFEVIVDGLTAEKKELSGKPMPDTYLEAAKKLRCTPEQAVVIEDAVSGVQAGRKGNFGLVIGIARKDNSRELGKNGADIVVSDLGEFELQS